MKRNIKAFTLVELVIVIAVIAVLAAVMIPTFGGLIKSAQKSADESDLASLNTQLAIMKIESEEDLQAVIATTYGAKADSFAPRSAKHGYHYWYDAVKNEFFLKPYDELEGPYEGALNAFAQLSQNSFRMFHNRYYLLDRGGSVVGEALLALDALSELNAPALFAAGEEDRAAQIQSNLVEKLGALAELEGNAMATALIAKLESIAIVTNKLTFAYDTAKVSKLYVLPGTEMISANIVTINGANQSFGADVQSDITVSIPATVEKICEKSLMFANGGSATLKVAFDVEANVGRFEANATNATIVDATKGDGYTYSISGTTVTGANGFTGTLEYSNKVTSFEIKPSDLSGDKQLFDSINQKVYVSHDVGAFSLQPYNIAATIDLATVEQGMVWSATGCASVDSNGVVTVSVPDKFSGNATDYTGTVTAKSVTDESVTAELTISVNTIRYATVNVGAKQLAIDSTALNNTFTLAYEGTPESAEYAIGEFACAYLQSEIAQCCTDVAPEFITSGDLFTVENGKLKLNLDADNLNGTQTLTVKVGIHLEKTFTVTVVDNSSAAFAKKFTNTYLYRVGNGNAIKLGSLFTADGNVKDAQVSFYDSAKATAQGRGPMATTGTNVFKYTYTPNADWTQSTVKFEGTGVVVIVIQDGANGAPVEIALEVVSGKNVTAASDFSGSTNYVLLNDITWGTTPNTAISGTIYGNGFAIDATNFAVYVDEHNNTALFALRGGTIDNLVINGPVYPKLVYQSDASTSNPYYVAGVYATGDASITNSYISGFREPIMADSTLLYVENTTLVGGNYANLWLNKGSLHLKDVTTVQEKKYATVGDTSKQILGAGIIVSNGISNLADITIEGYLNQYNWVTSLDKSYLDKDIQTAVGTLFGNSTIAHNDRINTGILFMGSRTNAVKDSRTDKASVPYQLVPINPATIYTHVTTNGAVSSFPTYDGYTSNAQMALKPTFKDNLNTTNGKLEFSIDIPNGETCTVDASIYTVSKYTGQNITVNISCNGGTKSGNTFTFSVAGTYTITYKVVDNTFYNADGSRKTDNVTDTYTVTVVVANSNHSNAVIDVSGVDRTIYYGLVGTTTDPDYEYCFAVLKGLKITDYTADGTMVTVSIPATELPSGLTITASNTDFNKVTTSGGVYYLGDSTADNKQDQRHEITMTYKYTGQNGTTVTETVTYLKEADTKGTQAYKNQTSPSTCVTPDTLVTLADGTQKEIQYVTYADQLLVWNFNTGSYDVMPAVIVMNHGYDNYTVTTLNFSDGTSVNTINGHGFFDAIARKYVILDNTNAAEYIGREFVKADGDGYTTVTLVSFNVSEQYTESWSVLTADQYNCILEGMWTLTPAEVEGGPEYLMPFEVGEDMKYDEAKMQADIEAYGLYTYEDFAEYCTYEQFVGFGFARFKISVEKGYITWADIEFLLDLHLGASN